MKTKSIEMNIISVHINEITIISGRKHWFHHILFFPFWPFGGDAVEPAANFVGILGAYPASEGLNATSDQSEIPVCVDLIIYWMIWAHCTSQHDVFL